MDSAVLFEARQIINWSKTWITNSTQCVLMRFFFETMRNKFVQEYSDVTQRVVARTYVKFWIGGKEPT